MELTQTILTPQKMETIVNFTLRTNTEKIVFFSTKKFYMEHANFSEQEAEDKAREKIIKTRKIFADISNPKSKNYFPY
jgi:hypothetical protein